MSTTTIDLLKSTPRDDEPYGYQSEAIDRLDEYFALKENAPTYRKSGVIVMPTGSGKTFTSVSWLLNKAAANGYQIIWLVHQQELVTQAYETIKDMSPILKNYNFKNINIVLQRGLNNHPCYTYDKSPLKFHLKGFFKNWL